MVRTTSRRRLPFPTRRAKKVKLSNTYFSSFPAGTGFASRSDSRYLARMDAPVSATDPPSGKISQRSASRSVSGTSILSHTVSFGNPAISVASAKGSLWYTTPPPKRFNAARCEVSELSSSSDSAVRSEEHTSELQSHSDLVCRLLLEKKKNPCSDER